MLNVFFNPYQLDKSISKFRLLGGIFFFIQILKSTSVSKGEPDQMTCFAASDLVMHCLPMSHKNTP